VRSTEETVGLQLSGAPAICTMFGPHKLSMGVSDLEIVEPYLIERSRHDGEVIRHCKILLSDISSIETVRYTWAMGWDAAYRGGLGEIGFLILWLLPSKTEGWWTLNLFLFVFLIYSVFRKQKFLVVRAESSSITIEIHKTDPILVEAFVESLSKRIGPNPIQN
jgi:hypothetical protein